jgi:phage terminase small subunit
MFEVTNETRADWAREALNVFAARTFSGETFDAMMEGWDTPADALTGDGPDALRDLLTNLLHLAREIGMDPVATHAGALRTFEDEEADG